MSYDSLTRFDRPLRVELGRSRLLTAAAAGIHAAAALSCLVAALHPFLRMLLLALTGAHLVYFLRRQVTATAVGAISAISWDRQRGWRVCAVPGGWQAAQPLMPVFVSAQLVAVRFRASNRRACSALIVGDRLAADDFRRLRVRLLQAARSRRDQASSAARPER